MRKSNIKKSIIFIIILIIIIGAVLVFYPKQKETIRIGYLPITASLPLFVSIEKGYFEEAGIDVTAENFATSNLIMESLIADRLDMTSSVAYSTLFPLEAQESGNFKIFSGVSETEDTYANFLLVKKGSNIKSISDLKGKKIVTRSGIAMKIYTSLVLSKFNINLDDVELQQVSPSLLIQAFNSPDVDAVYDVEPAMTTILEKDLGEILEGNPRGKYVINPFPVAGTIFSSKFLKENPSTAKKIIEITNKAIDYIRQNPDEAKKIMIKYIPLEEEIALKTRLYNFDKLTEVDKNSVQELANILSEHGAVDKEIMVSAMFY